MGVIQVSTGETVYSQLRRRDIRIRNVYIFVYISASWCSHEIHVEILEIRQVGKLVHEVN